MPHLESLVNGRGGVKGREPYSNVQAIHVQLDAIITQSNLTLNLRGLSYLGLTRSIS